MHRLHEPLVCVVMRTRTSLLLPRLRSALPGDALVVGPVVSCGEPFNGVNGEGEGSLILRYLVSQGQDQADPCRLIIRLGGEYVPADALGIAWFVEQAVALRLCQCSGDAIVRNRLELKHGASSSYN